MLLNHIFPTAFGPTAVVFQRDPLLAKRILLPCGGEKALRGAVRRAGAAMSGSTPVILRLCRALQSYFEGVPIETPWGLLDLTGLTLLQGSVLRAVAEVPWGETRSYQQIAARVGRPRACRFVGNTLALNPFPIVIPCHRIVRADGSAGGFGGGKGLKRRMLALEHRFGQVPLTSARLENPWPS